VLWKGIAFQMCERSHGKQVDDIGTDKYVHYVQSQAG